MYLMQNIEKSGNYIQAWSVNTITTTLETAFPH